MAAFYKGNKDAVLSVVVDIGSGSVGGSIVLFHPVQKIPEIVFIHRESIRAKHTSTAVGRARAMKKALKDVLTELSKNEAKLVKIHKVCAPIQQILLSYTAPWAQTVTQIIHFEQEKPFSVTHALVDDIIEHATERTETAYRKGRARSGRSTDMQVVEQSVINITLNGYAIEQPYGHEALEIDIAYLRGMVSETARTTTEEVMEKTFPNAAAHAHTSAMVQYCVLRDLYPKTANALIIDISGGATELSIMQHHILYESHTVHYGTHALIRDITETARTVEDEARSYLRAYKQELLTKKRELILDKACERYETMLERALDEITSRYALPRTIFLICEEDTGLFFTDAFAHLLKEKGGHKDKTIVPLTPQNTRELVKWSFGLVPDPRLAIAARFFHKLHACGEIDN